MRSTTETHYRNTIQYNTAFTLPTQGFFGLKQNFKDKNRSIYPLISGGQGWGWHLEFVLNRFCCTEKMSAEQQGTTLAVRFIEVSFKRKLNDVE